MVLPTAPPDGRGPGLRHSGQPHGVPVARRRMSQPYSCLCCPLGEASQQLVDLSRVLWLRWVGHTHGDVTDRGCQVCIVPPADLTYQATGYAPLLRQQCMWHQVPSPGGGSIQGFLLMWPQQPLPLAAPPSTLGSSTPASSSSRSQDFQNPSVKILQGWAGAQPIVHPKIPKERGCWGCRASQTLS